MKRPIPTLMFAAMMISCGPAGQVPPEELPVVDVTASYPAKNIVLQDVADVEYVPLETASGFRVDDTRVKYMDGGIAILTNRLEDIMIFDRRTGKGLASFNHKGRGPGEYTYVGPLAVDAARGEIFVRDANNLPVHVYDMQGKPLRTLDLKRNLGWMAFFHDWDDEHMFFYTPYDERRPERAPYGLLSKTDTTATVLPPLFEGRESMNVRIDFSGGRYMIATKNDVALAKTADGYMISEPGFDTMYRWDKSAGGLTPVMTRTPSWGSMEYPVGLFWVGESSGYTFLQTIERKMDIDGSSQDIVNARPRGHKTVNLARDKSDGAIYEATLLNGDFADEREFVLQNNFGVPAGTFVAALQPYELLDLHAEGKLKGRLAELVPTLKEDDNPVMMIATFKP